MSVQGYQMRVYMSYTPSHMAVWYRGIVRYTEASDVARK